MWQLLNRTPFAAERTWVRDRDGHHHWIVGVKATYDLRDEAPRLADCQEPPLLLPTYTGEPGASSVYHDADLGPRKPTTDVLLHGKAHAPRGRTSTVVDVSLRVGPVRKTVRVFGPRVYERAATGIAPGDAEPFATCDLTYEWAFGGHDVTPEDPREHLLDPRNPVGKGVALARDHLLDTPAHRLEYPDGRVSKAGPAGFGPIAPGWSPRRELAGTFDDAWQRSRRPLLPLDFDERHLQSAPHDQQAPRPLVGGEPVELVGCTAKGRSSFALPRVRLEFVTRLGAERHSHAATLATVLIEPERERLILVWQTSLPVASRDTDRLDATLVTGGPA